MTHPRARGGSHARSDSTFRCNISGVHLTLLLFPENLALGPARSSVDSATPGGIVVRGWSLPRPPINRIGDLDLALI